MSTLSKVTAAIAERELEGLEDGTASRCKHVGCDCSIPSFQEYCSEPCEKAESEGRQSCPCGHPECISGVHERLPEPSHVV